MNEGDQEMSNPRPVHLGPEHDATLYTVVVRVARSLGAPPNALSPTMARVVENLNYRTSGHAIGADGMFFFSEFVSAPDDPTNKVDPDAQLDAPTAGLDGWSIHPVVRNYDLVRRALSTFLGALGRPATVRDVDAFNVAIRAYQVAEDTRSRLVTAVKETRADDAAQEALLECVAQGSVALDAAVKLVAAAIKPRAIEDVVLDAPALGDLATVVEELADSFDDWLDGRGS